MRRALLFMGKNRRLPPVRNPKLFTDKVNWRVLRDRRDMLGPTCDKLAMKQLARAMAGDAVQIPRTCWSGVDLSELDSVELPAQWILKPTLGSGQVIEGSGRPDVAALTVQTKSWLNNEKHTVMGEWGYSLSTPQFLVEERIGDGRTLPPDYKFFVFDGTARYVLHVNDRANDPRASYYDTAWIRVATHPGAENLALVPPPPQLTEMFDVAERIAAGFDFLRVDLYDVDGRIWFGETTAYPVSGFGRYEPKSFDAELGKWWTLPNL